MDVVRRKHYWWSGPVLCVEIRDGEWDEVERRHGVMRHTETRMRKESKTIKRAIDKQQVPTVLINIWSVFTLLFYSRVVLGTLGRPLACALLARTETLQLGQIVEQGDSTLLFFFITIKETKLQTIRAYVQCPELEFSDCILILIHDTEMKLGTELQVMREPGHDFIRMLRTTQL